MVNEIDQFLEYLEYEKNASIKTVESYNDDLIQFQSFLMGENIDEKCKFEQYCIDIIKNNDDLEITSVGQDEITGFIEYCYDRGLKKSSISRKIACLRSFFKFLYNNDFISHNPAYKIHFPKGVRRIPKFLYLDQVEELLSFKIKRLLDYRDRALLEVFYSSGARVSEISSADLVHLYLESKSFKVLGKGGDERTVFLTEDSVLWLKRYLKARKQKYGSLRGPLFINSKGRRISVRGIFYIIEKRAKECGLAQKVSPHTLRHSFATELLNQGADIRAIQEMLGHKNISTTQIYTQVGIRQLKQVHSGTHPGATLPARPPAAAHREPEELSLILEDDEVDDDAVKAG